MTGTNCKNLWSWRLMPPSLALSISCQSSSQITAPVHSSSVNSASNLPHPHTVFIYLFILFLRTPVSLLAHSSSAHPTIPVFNRYIVITSPPWPIYCLYLSYPTSFAHAVYIFFYCIIAGMFVYSMCISVVLYVTNCYALSWPGRSCKWELVLNYPTWLNNGEINTKIRKRELIILQCVAHCWAWPV